MGYVDQGCKNINISREDEHLWITADCPQDNGVIRTSRIDLNLCIGLASVTGASTPEDGVQLIALNLWKPYTLIGQHLISRNWHLLEEGRIFKCEIETKDAQWKWTEFPLNDYLNNVDGHLEFWASRGVALINYYDRLNGHLSRIYVNDKERKQYEGWREKEKRWTEGTVIKDWRICRMGS